MRWGALFLVLSVFVYAGKIEWMPFSTSLKQAEKEEKYIFLYFHADWCSYCTKMKKTSFVDSAVTTELDKNYYSICLDTESKKIINTGNGEVTMEDFAEYLEVSSLPTLFFAKVDNGEVEILGRHSSFADASLLYHLLTYISSGEREKGTEFVDYIDSL